VRARRLLNVRPCALTLALRSISVAWCKEHEVPIEKIFTKVLLEKFGVRTAAWRRVFCALT
jgi:hypothetical protein